MLREHGRKVDGDTRAVTWAAGPDAGAYKTKLVSASNSSSAPHLGSTRNEGLWTPVFLALPLDSRDTHDPHMNAHSVSTLEQHLQSAAIDVERQDIAATAIVTVPTTPTTPASPHETTSLP